MADVFYGNEPVLTQPQDQAEEHFITTQSVIGEKEIAEAAKILAEYKAGKENLESRIVEDEQWYKLRHWEVIRRNSENPQPQPTSAWLFNSILNKHADAMDNFPTPIVLPRERSDEKSAKTLCSVLPVVMEYNDFEQTYNDAWWEKLKHGTSVYGVFWDNDKENGLGDIAIRQISLLKIFWEPGIEDIQDSRNLFIVDLVDEDLLDEMYPEHKGHMKGDAFTVKDFVHDDNIDTSKKTVVVDWYYKVKRGTKTILHYAKFVGNTLLYASENDPSYMDRGYYDHGLYPIVFDVLFPEKGTPCGFGYVAICKDPQLYIDKLSANILEASMMGSKKRFFVSNSTGVSEQEFLDWNKPIVHVEGEIGEERIREININPPAPIYHGILQMKIEEMKDTSANRDVNSGSGGGVSAASAIAALQEAGNKSSRDMIAASYRAYQKLVLLCLELMRQFYDEARSFRITGDVPGKYEFVDMSNIALKEQVMGVNAMGEEMYRKPIFDLKIRAQKKNPFSRMEENERAKELYGLGFFNPERAQEALGAIEMMDFEGIDKVKEQIQNGQTLLNQVMMLMQQNQQLMQMLGAVTGVPAPVNEQPEQGGGNAPQTQAPANGESPDAKNKTAAGIMQAQKPMTSYGQRLAKRSSPDMNTGSAKDLAK